MAEQLSVGKREVFTTASSLANRMGVVAGQTGDPVALASSQLGQTLNTLAKQKLVQEEENWKNNLKAKALETISGYANENRYDPSNFMNQASAYSDSIIEEAPKAFKSWSKGYLASIITQESNTIIDATWMRNNQEAKTNMFVGNDSELNNMLDQINKTDSLNHTTLFGENLMPRLSEMHATYEKIWNSLPTNMRGDMLPPDAMLKEWKVQLEEGRIKSVVSEMLENAIEVDKQRIASGQLVGNEIDGWSGESAVTETLKLIKESMVEYESDGFDTFGNNELTGPFTFTDVDNDKRSEIKVNIETHADGLVNDHKVESAALTNQEQSELTENINLFTGGGPGSVNDTFSLFETETALDKYISENFVGASNDQIKQIKDAWRVAHIVKNTGMIDFTKMENGGHTFLQAVDNIVHQAALSGIKITKKEAELQLANHMAGYAMAGFQEGVPYFDVTKVGFTDNGQPSNELIALSNLTQKLGYLHPAFKSILDSAHQINIDENPEAIFSLANVVGYLNSRSGYVPKDAQDATSWNALLGLSKQLEFLQSAESGGTVMTKEKLLERYKLQINPDSTTLDEKIDRIDRAIKSDTIWHEGAENTALDGNGFHEAIKFELRDMIDQAAKDNTLWGNFGLTYLRDFFGWSDEDAAAIRDMVSPDWKDLNFMLDEMMPMFEELVTHHLAASYATPGEILPSNIKDHFSKAVQGAIKEMGNQGWMFTQ